MPTPQEASDLLKESLAAIDDELQKNPTPARKSELEKARQEINDQLDVLQAAALHQAAGAVKKAADALQKVVESGSTDPLAILVARLRELAKKA